MGASRTNRTREQKARRRTIVVSVVAAIVVSGAVLHRLELRDLRRLEQDYIAAREPTACATQQLVPQALGQLDIDELDKTVLALTTAARDDSVRVQKAFAKRKVVPLPPVRGARSALADALDRQVDLYEAMIDEPDASKDDLRALGLANTRFERRAETVRNVLFVGEGTGWDRRFVCDEEPPLVPPD